MKIDLRTTKTLCLSMPSAFERRKKFSELMDKLEFKNWSFYDAVQGKDVAEGCAKSNIAILKNYDFSEPLLLLEDDINVTENYTPEIHLFENVDALYLGYSSWAWEKWRAYMSTFPEETSVEYHNGLYRIKRMLSTHAILYINQDYANDAVEAMHNHLIDPYSNRHCDVALGRLQEEKNVYAVPKAFFFQDCIHNTQWTKVNIQQ